MKNDVIVLITLVKGRDSDGFRIEEERHDLEVMADVRSVRHSEFYEAVHAGMSVQLIVAVNFEDYEAASVEDGGRKIRPEVVEYDGTTYKIIRAYRKKRRMEMTLQEVE